MSWLFIFNIVIMKRDVLNTIISEHSTSGEIVNPDVEKVIYYGRSAKKTNFTPADIKSLGYTVDAIDRFITLQSMVFSGEYLVVAIPTEFNSPGSFVYGPLTYNLVRVQTLNITDVHGNDYSFDIFVFKYPYGSVSVPVTISNMQIL